MWSQKFEALAVRGDGRVVLHFAGQTDQVANLVVGANGTRSGMLPCMATVPEFTGTVAMQGSIPEPAIRCPTFAALVNGGNLMARGEGELLFAHTKADGGLHYYLSFRQPADWFTQHGLTTKLVVVTQFLSQELAQWVPMYHEGFRVTAAFEFLTIYRRVLLVAGYAVS